MSASPNHADEHQHEDGCLCGLSISEDEITHDSQLPPATGGLERSLSVVDENVDDEIDMAALPEDEITHDEDLPEAHVRMI